MKLTELKNYSPAFKEEWLASLNRILEHKSAPHWNAKCGDRLTNNDHAKLDEYKASLQEFHAKDSEKKLNKPPQFIFEMIEEQLADNQYYQNYISNFNIKSEFNSLRTMKRSDLQEDLHLVVPKSIDLNRLVINPTSGTCGQPIMAPNHPQAVGSYDVFYQFILSELKITPELSPETVMAIQVCSQKKTITYTTLHSYLKGSGFAKINLNKTDWPNESNIVNFIDDLQPIFLSGDPYSFNHLLKLNLKHKPQAIFSTSMAMPSNVYYKLKERFGCPIVNLYSLNETGPIAFSIDQQPYLKQLPHDIFIEILDEYDQPVNEDQQGEVCISGGRNPYLPLLRYRTGDHGKKKTINGKDHLQLTRARQMKLMVDQSNKQVNILDIQKALWGFPISNYSIDQDKAKEVTIALKDQALPIEIIQIKIKEAINQVAPLKVRFTNVNH